MKPQSEKNPDCGCIIHPGQTHEEHMDELDKKLNRAMLPTDHLAPISPALLRAFCEAEVRRLKEKERNMESGKIRVDPMNTENNNMKALQVLANVADGLFMDCKVDGFDKDKAIAYNMLMSAMLYLKTGNMLIGNRTSTFFGL